MEARFSTQLMRAKSDLDHSIHSAGSLAARLPQLVEGTVAEMLPLWTHTARVHIPLLPLSSRVALG